MRTNKVALIPTLISAAPWQETRRRDPKMAGRTNTALLITKDDVKIKRFRDKSGTLFIFMVDASGSMALNRMRQAKGAVASLLQNAYVHRDQVALISFRGKQAQVLLPPSQSVDRAKRELDVLPTGGGTPLASSHYRGPWDIVRERNLPSNIRRHRWDDLRRYRDIEYRRHDRSYWEQRDRNDRERYDREPRRDDRRRDERDQSHEGRPR